MNNKRNIKKQSLSNIRLAKNVVKILDIKCRKGCSDENYSWVGFENGNGTECGADIERMIKQAKQILSKK